jgi:diguanylate cyclase (GGDEF)-like protein
MNVSKISSWPIFAKLTVPVALTSVFGAAVLITGFDTEHAYVSQHVLPKERAISGMRNAALEIMKNYQSYAIHPREDTLAELDRIDDRLVVLKSVYAGTVHEGTAEPFFIEVIDTAHESLRVTGDETIALQNEIKGLRSEVEETRQQLTRLSRALKLAIAVSVAGTGEETLEPAIVSISARATQLETAYTAYLETLKFAANQSAGNDRIDLVEPSRVLRGQVDEFRADNAVSSSLADPTSAYLAVIDELLGLGAGLQRRIVRSERKHHKLDEAYQTFAEVLDRAHAVMSEEVDDSFAKIWRITTQTIVAGLAAILLISWLVSRSISGSVRELRNVARSYGEGKFQVRATERRDDELGELSKAVNEMADNIVAHISERDDIVKALTESEENLQQQIIAIRDREERLEAQAAEMVAIAEDLAAAEAEMTRLANHDALTGLPSLRLCKDRMNTAFERADRYGGDVALMFVDLDGFKSVNDDFGHDAGDIVLKEVAGRLEDLIRKADTVARIGGDEFIVIITDVNSDGDVAEVAERIVHSLSSPIETGTATAQIGASVGIAMYPRDGQDGDALIRRADQSMYAIKKSGKNNFAFVSNPKISAVG